MYVLRNANRFSTEKLDYFRDHNFPQGTVTIISLIEV